MKKALEVTKIVVISIASIVGFLFMGAFIWFQYINPIIHPEDSKQGASNERCGVVGRGAASYEECIDEP